MLNNLGNNMPLEEYLKRHNLTAYGFSKLSGFSTVTIWRLLKGFPCRLKTAKKIYRMTKNTVRLHEDLPQV